MTFYTSDLHLNHNRILQFGRSQFSTVEDAINWFNSEIEYHTKVYQEALKDKRSIIERLNRITDEEIEEDIISNLTRDKRFEIEEIKEEIFTEVFEKHLSLYISNLFNSPLVAGKSTAYNVLNSVLSFALNEDYKVRENSDYCRQSFKRAKEDIEYLKDCFKKSESVKFDYIIDSKRRKILSLKEQKATYLEFINLLDRLLEDNPFPFEEKNSSQNTKLFIAGL